MLLFMQPGLFFISVVLTALLAPLAVSAQSWRVGQEMEVDTNFHATLLSEVNGWRIWRFDERGGHTCAAIRPAEGRPHPVPLGVDVQMMRRGSTPYVDFRTYSDGLVMGGVRTHYHGRARVHLRREGDRFSSENGLIYSEISEYAGSVVRVDAESWEYPALLIGLQRETGVLDLTHMEEALTAAKECAVSR